MSKDKRSLKDRSAYNNARINEEDDVLLLLYQLCNSIEEEPQDRGAPRIALRDMVFSIVYKVYLRKSAQRCGSNIRAAHNANYISRFPHPNSISHYMNKIELAWLLTRLVEISSLPLAQYETEFAVDSTGLSTDRYARWLDEREMAKQKREWHKLHIMCARHSHIVTAVLVTASAGSDTVQFKQLFEVTSRNFRVLQVTADGAYYAGHNILQVTQVHGKPYFYIPRNSLPNVDCHISACNAVLYLYSKDKAEFFKNYYKRNNVETVFSMIKAVFGVELLSRNRVAQYNEAICKVLCHNLRVLAMTMHKNPELSINFESVKSYVERTEAAANLLADKIAGGRIILPAKKKRDVEDNVADFILSGAELMPDNLNNQRLLLPQKLMAMRTAKRKKTTTTLKKTEETSESIQITLF